MNKKFAFAVATFGALAACSDAPAPTGPALNAPDAPSLSAGEGSDFVPGEVIVKFREGTSAEGRAAALGRANGQAGERILTAMMRRSGDSEGLTIVHTSAAVPAAIAALRGSEDVEYAEPNYIYQHNATSNDSYYTNGSLWGMYGDATAPANQWGSQAGEAWAAGKTNCSAVYVGIIDEGYMYNHVDLAANAGTNPGEIAGNGADDDGNGYVDDVYGWDFDGSNSSIFDGSGDDHGTHVAGTIGGVGGNGSGVAGVCWSVKLMNAKFLGRNGGTTANAVKAVDYFTDLKTRHGLNLVATSNSWGGGGFSQALGDAIGRANAAGILFIAAPGNSTYNCETTACYPASYSNANVISVASITNTGAISSFSNFGVTTIDIGAPGSGIWSTVPVSSKGKVVSGYSSYSGTSMATPRVSGAAALYAAYHPGSSAATIKAAILNSAVPTASLAGKTVTGGRLNVSGF
ncbi:MAG: S8 family peptidase [Gemmatimonadaceae bacterium]